MNLDDMLEEPLAVKVEVFNPEYPFGGVQVENAADNQIQIEINTGSPVRSVFGRVGNILANCNDYALCYAPMGTGIPTGGTAGQTLTKLSDSSLDVGWSSAGAGNVITDESALSGQLARWIDGTHLEGFDTTAQRLLGRGQGAGNGPAQEIILGTNLSMSGTTLNASGGGTAGGNQGEFQYNDSGGFAGTANLVLDTVSGEFRLNTNGFLMLDNADPTKRIEWNLANVPTGTTEAVLVPNSVNPVIVAADAGSTNNFLTGITNLGVITKARPTIGNLTDLSGASKLIGSASGGAGVVEIVLGTNLSMSGNTLNASGAGSPGGSTGDIQINNGSGGFAGAALVNWDDTNKNLHITANDTNTALREIMYLTHNRSDTAGNNGLGIAIIFQAETSTTDSIEQGGISTRWTDATHASRKALMTLSVVNNGIYHDVVGVTPDLGLLVRGDDTFTSSPGAGFVDAQNGFKINGTNIFPVSMANGGVPAGGTTDQVLAKNSNADRDLKWATATGGGNVSNSGTPTADQLPIWTDATHIKGVTGLTGGSLGQVLKKSSATDYDWSWATVSGTGDVVGPASATDNALVRFDTTTGKLIKNSAVTLDDSRVISTTGTDLTIQQTGDTFGATSLVLKNRAGANGAVFTNSALDLVDFGFTSSAPASANLRFEHRTGNVLSGNTDGEFQLLLGSASPAFEFGRSVSVFTSRLGFAAYAVSPTQPPDVGIARNAAGILEINDGTAGVYRDLYARNVSLQSSGAITGNGSVPTGGTTDQVLAKNSNTNYDLKWATAAGGGNVSNSGTPTANQIAQWTDATHIQGVTPTSPITVGAGSLSLDVSVDHAFTAAQSLTVNDGQTINPTTLLTIGHNSTGTPGTGFGGQVDFKLEDSTTSNVSAGFISVAWSDATHNSNVSQMTFGLDNVGSTPSSAMILSGNGKLDVSLGYTIGGIATTNNLLRGDGTAFKSATLDTAIGGAGGAISSNGLVKRTAANTYSAVTAPSGDVVGTTDTQTLTNKRINPRVDDQNPPSSPYACNSDNFDMAVLRGINAALTLNAPTGTPVQGQKLIFRFKDNGTARGLTFQTGSAGQFRFSSDMAAPSTTIVNMTLYMAFIYNSTDSRWDNVAQMNNF